MELWNLGYIPTPEVQALPLVIFKTWLNSLATHIPAQDTLFFRCASSLIILVSQACPYHMSHVDQIIPIYWNDNKYLDPFDHYPHDFEEIILLHTSVNSNHMTNYSANIYMHLAANATIVSHFYSKSPTFSLTIQLLHIAWYPLHSNQLLNVAW